ncbi:hypothetical protein EG329_005582 [Mollisiaceae sp. DMI_Dod_QoI]|nr:hypothetical protein EG329_005582 [Helotiales sp. DMI_Dod_QoI]
MSDNSTFVNIELNEYSTAGADGAGEEHPVTDAQTTQLGFIANDEDEEAAVAAQLMANAGTEGQDAADADMQGQQNAPTGDDQGGQPNEQNAVAFEALVPDNGVEDNGQHDLEAAPLAGNVAHAYVHPGWGMHYFLHANLLCMVAAIVVSFLSDPTYNARLAAKKLSGLFLGLPERALRAINWSIIGLWIACFVVHASRGEWSRLEAFKQKCLRLVCLSLGVAALLLKWIEPEHINLSYAPGVITIVVEITYLYIDVLADAACFFFLEAVPWMATTGKPLLSFIGALVTVIVIWTLYKG